MNADKNPIPFFQLEGEIWTNKKTKWFRNNSNCSHVCCYTNTYYPSLHWFQLQLENTINSLDDVTSIDVRKVSDNTTVAGLTINYNIIIDSSNRKYLLIDIDITSGLIGAEYYISVETILKKYYSETFCVATQNYKRVGISWAGNCRVGNMVYSSDFKHKMNLDAIIVPLETEIEETTIENGFGEETPSLQKLKQPYMMSCVVPNFIAEALSAIQLHDKFNVFNFRNKDPYVEEFDSSISNIKAKVVPEDNECLSFVEITFTKETIIKSNCCEEFFGFLELSNIIAADNQCLTQGAAKSFTVTGAPFQTIKFKLEVILHIGPVNFSVTVYDQSTNNGLLIWFNPATELENTVTMQLDENGEGTFVVQACFNQCTYPNSASMNLEMTLYNSDLTTLSASSFILEAETDCHA